MSVRYAIMGLLHYEDMHGYRIKEHLERNFGHMWTVNFGQIYPELKKLNEEGMVNMIRETQENAPPRKVYSITDKGREDFAEWLASDPERGIVLRDPFLLRFTFFGFGDRERALDIIDGQIGEYEQQLVRRRGNMARWRRMDMHVRLVAELGVSLNEMILEWLERARKELSEPAAEEKRKRVVMTAGRRRR
jgi:DNA-binding PadR family transcriptional regulator